MRCLQSYAVQLTDAFSIISLFSERPIISFREEIASCPHCRGMLQVYKTEERIVVTMAIGEFVARETIISCEECKSKMPSKDLKRLVPDRCKFGYDMIEYVGKAQFLECRRDQDIVDDLGKRGISISDREIAYLGKKFIIYLALAHQDSRKQICASMEKRGGYILHLDGTSDGDSPHLMSGLDGLSKIVLGNIKIPSENSEQIIPFLKDIKQNYGTPLALVHDMGTGIQKAVDAVFPGVADFICHFHFLRDIGKDLLNAEDQLIRKCLKNSKIRTLLRQKAKRFNFKLHADSLDEVIKSLDQGRFPVKFSKTLPKAVAGVIIQWILDADNEADGYGFPFDRHHFVFCKRLFIARQLLEGIKENSSKTAPVRALVQLYKLLNSVLNNRHLHQAAKKMEQKIEVFDKLRNAMRIAVPEGDAGLNDDGMGDNNETIENNLTEIISWCKGDNFPFVKEDYMPMIKQIEKYWGKLFAKPITIQTKDGPIVVFPNRTNNILERLFRHVKRQHRRKTGTTQMSRALKAMLADTPLVRNLSNDEYVSILLAGKTNLAERFADIDTNLVRKKLKENRTSQQRLPTNLIKLIRRKKLTEEINAAFGGAAYETMQAASTTAMSI